MNSDTPLTRRQAVRFKKRRPSSLTIPERAAPHVRFLFSEMKRQNVGYDEIELHAGPRRAALKSWRARSYPSLDSLEAALGYLGWAFLPIPTAKALDPALVAALAPIAESFEMTMPATFEALIAIVTRIQNRAAPTEAPSTAPYLADLAP